MALTAAGFAVLRGYRWVLATAVVALGGQVVAVVGTVWELVGGIAEFKAAQLREIGVDPTLGVTINLVYSGVAMVLFGWFAVRWLRDRQQRQASR